MSNGRHDIVIRGGNVVTPDTTEVLDVAVTDGRISAVARPGGPLPADTDVDATGLYVLPGGIDTHTHVRWPVPGGRTDDGFDGAGRVAALGGTTTQVDFVPPLEPGQRLADAAAARIADIERNAAVDVALHPILNRVDDGVLADIPKVIDDGMTSFKIFTTYPENMVDDGGIWTLMRQIAGHGGMPGFHAENHAVVEESTRRLAEASRTSIQDFAPSRPGLAEALAIGSVCLMARKLDTPVYIFHVSGAEALGAVEQARGQGGAVHAETCTHYLAHDDTVFDRPDGWKFVITPPIRTAADRRYLWDRAADGAITSVGSDHCAYSLESKSAHPEDHRLTPPGAAGIQSRTPVLWNEAVNRHGLTPRQFVRLSAENAARALGLWPRKGAVRLGSDADLVLWDQRTEWSGGDLPPASTSTFDIYDRYRGRGLPKHVFLRGHWIVQDGTYTGTPGQGQYINRPKRRES